MKKIKLLLMRSEFISYIRIYSRWLNAEKNADNCIRRDWL